MTHTAKHTPGPWKAVPDKSRNMYTWYVEGAKGVVPTIARLSLIDACEEIESNAHLIAAAPAMYEALKQTFNVMENILTDSQLDTRTLCGLTIREWSTKVRAALAQAEGK